MLKPAQLYADQLNKLFVETAYDERFKYLHGVSYVDEYKPANSSWNCHEFVSMRDDEIIGYIKYSIDRDTYNITGLKAVNFTLQVNLVFAKDLRKVLVDIFEKYIFNKIMFGCIIGNPIEPTYDKMVKKYGGRVVGICKKDAKLLDGLLYDVKRYEILREDYLKTIK